MFIITLSVSAACAAVVIGRIRPRHATTVAKSYIAQCGFEPDLKLKHIHYFGIIADRKPGTANYAQFIDSAHPKGVKTTVTPTIVDGCGSSGVTRCKGFGVVRVPVSDSAVSVRV
ncbi:MAG: hypothetical protein ACYCU3_19190 [Streptosporangiaceae bacterium]